MIQLQKIFHKIVHIGIDADMPYFLQLRIKIINHFAFIIVLGALLMSILGMIEGESDYYNAFIMATAATVVFFFNSKRWFNVSRYYSNFVYPLFLLYILCIYGPEIKIEFGFFAFMLSSVIFFKRELTRAINISYLICLQALGLYISYNYEPIYASSVDYYDGFLVLGITMLCCFLLMRRYYNESVQAFKKQEDLVKTLEENNHELVRLNEEIKAKNNLFTILAHDLKSPISSFKNLTKKFNYLIQRGDKERIRDLSASYESKGNRLFYNLDNLFNWVISQKEGIEIKEENINLKESIDGFIAMQKSFFSQKFLRFENHVDPELCFVSDASILQIIISNVINNAIKFSEEGGLVQIACNQEGRNLELNITDSGKGMDPIRLQAVNDQSKIHKLDALKSKEHGLGLKTCFYLIKKLGGQILLESESGKGTNVKITLVPKEIILRKNIKEHILSN